MNIDLTQAEIFLLAEKLCERAQVNREIGEDQPLRPPPGADWRNATYDSDTKRYEYFEKATRLQRRAIELRSLARRDEGQLREFRRLGFKV